MKPTNWQPADNPDPQQILESAGTDRREGRHAQALAKYLWFHANALKYQPALSGVRLSFALSYWMDLANEYPPAMAGFIYTRDEAEIGCRNEVSFELFHDLASMNRQLGDHRRTADLFVEIAATNRPAAELLYHVAESDLIAVGRYVECLGFLDAEKRLEMAAEHCELTKKLESARPQLDIPIPEYARPAYINDVATVVALLAINDRVQEARDACEVAYQVLDDEDFRAVLAAALTGRFSQMMT